MVYSFMHAAGCAGCLAPRRDGHAVPCTRRIVEASGADAALAEVVFEAAKMCGLPVKWWAALAESVLRTRKVPQCIPVPPPPERSSSTHLSSEVSCVVCSLLQGR